MPQDVPTLQEQFKTGEVRMLCFGAMIAVWLRCFFGTFPHSGEGTPPMYGDFEAQRHWMEITTALPPAEWYENTTRNDLMYWGLDYPPLTAYHSWVLGKLGHHIAPECFELEKSRGHESRTCRWYMRISVLVSDILIFMPAVLWAVSNLSAASGGNSDQKATMRVLSVWTLWLLPPLLLIDHGHFQYNGVCFGFCFSAVGSFARSQFYLDPLQQRLGKSFLHMLVASFFFTCALLYKQIALYYAPAFFFAILAYCMQISGRAEWAKSSFVFSVLANGGIVILTTALIFSPWLTSYTAVQQVIHRMFPFARGLYEDKVANIWCSISPVLKRFPTYFTISPFTSAAFTLTCLLPACSFCLAPGRKACPTFIVALVASSLSFFLFAFQVHEKAILFPCAAMCLLPVSLGPKYNPKWMACAICHFTLVCTYSMYPLVVKDRLYIPYLISCVALTALSFWLPSGTLQGWCNVFFVVAAMVIHVIHFAAPPLPKYPDAWTLLITGSSCGYFVLSWMSLTYAQYYNLSPIPGAPSPTNEKED